MDRWNGCETNRLTCKYCPPWIKMSSPSQNISDMPHTIPGHSVTTTVCYVEVIQVSDIETMPIFHHLYIAAPFFHLTFFFFYSIPVVIWLNGTKFLCTCHQDLPGYRSQAIEPISRRKNVNICNLKYWLFRGIYLLRLQTKKLVNTYSR